MNLFMVPTCLIGLLYAVLYVRTYTCQLSRGELGGGAAAGWALESTEELNKCMDVGYTFHPMLFIQNLRTFVLGGSNSPATPGGPTAPQASPPGTEPSIARGAQLGRMRQGPKCSD